MSSPTPTGLESYSPGLLGTSYPGYALRKPSTLKGLKRVSLHALIQPFQGWFLVTTTQGRRFAPTLGCMLTTPLGLPKDQFMLSAVAIAGEN